MQNLKYTPIEMPVGRKYGSDYFVVKSYKIKRIIHLYSNLEFKNWLTLETDPEVQSFCEQPYKAEMLISGERKATIFDMWVLYRNGIEEFQEIKYSDQLTDPLNKDYLRCSEQVAFQKKWCKANKINYVIRSENSIELSRFYIENMLHISSCIKSYDPIYAKSFYNQITKLIGPTETTLENLYYALGSPIYFDEFLSIISFAYYDGIVALNILKDELGLNTEVRLYGK